MKRLFISLLVLWGFVAMAQKESNPTQIAPTVVEVDSSFTKEDVYRSVKLYVSEAFKDANQAVKMDDLNLGLIVVKGTYPNYMKGIFGEKNPAGFWHFTAKFEVKDGRYRYSVYDIYLEQTYQTSDPAQIYDWNDWRAKRLRELIADLDQKFGAISIEAATTDDW